MDGYSIFFILAGLFTLFAAQSNWNWFWNHPRAKGIIWIFRGRKGARVFYLIIGVALLVGGISGFI
tara:strand:+ start:305 stop:502 length:198 start_codon:yes stop_codon:yes gene_type:complete